jgi:hypothetical protein
MQVASMEEVVNPLLVVVISLEKSLDIDSGALEVNLLLIERVHCRGEGRVNQHHQNECPCVHQRYPMPLQSIRYAIQVVLDPMEMARRVLRL